MSEVIAQSNMVGPWCPLVKSKFTERQAATHKQVVALQQTLFLISIRFLGDMLRSVRLRFSTPQEQIIVYWVCCDKVVATYFFRNRQQCEIRFPTWGTLATDGIPVWISGWMQHYLAVKTSSPAGSIIALLDWEEWVDRTLNTWCVNRQIENALLYCRSGCFAVKYWNNETNNISGPRILQRLPMVWKQAYRRRMSVRGFCLSRIHCFPLVISTMILEYCGYLRGHGRTEGA